MAKELKGIEIDNLGRTLVYPIGAEEDVYSILQGREYPISLVELDRVEQIVDVGAHIGSSTVYFHALFPNAQITAFEPSSGNFELLARNTVGLPGVNILPWGLASRFRRARLYLSKGHGQAASSTVFNMENHTGKFEEIALHRASKEPVFEKGEISILKIDTEGHELDILADLSPMLHRVMVLFMEVHSESERAELDAFLSPRFVLRHCHVPMVHRYTLMYLNAEALCTGRIRTCGAPELRAAS